MHGKKTILILLAAGLLALASSCTNDSLDDGDSANTVLQLQQVTVPPVTAADDGLGNCTFTITESTATLENEPKSVGAIESPFNDVLVESLTISYTWDDGVFTPPHTTSMRVSIPAGGTGQVRFYAITGEQLVNAPVPRDGHLAEMDFVFSGHSEDGQRITALGGAALFVNSCVAAGP